MKFMKSLLTKEDERALREMATECGYADVMNAFGVDEFYHGYIKGFTYMRSKFNCRCDSS